MQTEGQRLLRPHGPPGAKCDRVDDTDSPAPPSTFHVHQVGDDRRRECHAQVGEVGQRNGCSSLEQRVSDHSAAETNRDAEHEETNQIEPLLDPALAEGHLGGNDPLIR